MSRSHLNSTLPLNFLGAIQLNVTVVLSLLSLWVMAFCASNEGSIDQSSINRWSVTTHRRSVALQNFRVVRSREFADIGIGSGRPSSHVKALESHSFGSCDRYGDHFVAIGQCLSRGGDQSEGRSTALGLALAMAGHVCFATGRSPRVTVHCGQPTQEDQLTDQAFHRCHVCDANVWAMD